MLRKRFRRAPSVTKPLQNKRKRNGSTEESNLDQRPASVTFCRDFEGSGEGALTDSDGSRGDSLEDSRVFSGASQGHDSLLEEERARVADAVMRALGALDVGRLDIARETLRALLLGSRTR